MQGAHKRLQHLVLAGLPLGAVLMLVSLNVNIPRYFIERNLGVKELGIFASIANLMIAGNLVIGALGQGATPRMAKYFSTAQIAPFRSLVLRLAAASLALGAAGLIVALLFGRQAITIIYRAEYSTRQDIFIWLMGASGLYYLGSMLSVAATAIRCFTPQLAVFAASTVATALACMVLVPSHGLLGAAFALLISTTIQCAGSAVLLHNACSRAEALPTGISTRVAV
jgi:O-antigen/teichoic acid export membrane protein